MTKKLIWDDVSTVGKLHCDNPSCGHVLPESLPWGPQLMGYECPKCGSDMLTRQDYDLVERMQKWVNRLNRWFGWLGSETPPTNADTTQIRFREGKAIIHRRGS